MSHRHKFWFVDYTRGSLVDAIDHTMIFLQGSSTWICECGKLKYVETKTPLSPPNKLKALEDSDE